MTSPFEQAWVRSSPFGVLAAVHLPAGTEPVDDAVLATLHPREASAAREERGRRQIELVGGRLAWRAAARAVGLRTEDWPLLNDSSRAPLSPPGASVSVSHKEDLAVALVAPSREWLVGLDLEGGSRDRSAIIRRVCRPEEVSAIESLAEPERWPAVLRRFAIKEAIYKAIAPDLGRFFGFMAARVDDGDRVTLFLEQAEPTYEVEVAVEPLPPDRVLAMVRARRADRR